MTVDELKLGDKVIFECVPNGSYLSANKVYTVEDVSPREIHFRAKSGSGTSETRAMLSCSYVSFHLAPAPVATGTPIVCEPWPTVDPKRTAWMESILSNDENSTDYELGLFFIAHAVPQETAQAYIARRTDYLNSL
jgi:hypothetical protein